MIESFTKRIRYINDPAFQFRYAVLLTGLGLFCFALMGFLTYLAVYRVAEGVLTGESGRELLTRVLVPSAVFGRADVLVPVAIFTGFLFCLGIVGTQRFAGPLFAIQRHLERFQTGRQRGPLRLRASDELKDLADTLNSFLLFLLDRDKVVHESLDELRAHLEKGESEAARRKIDEIRAVLGRSQS